LNIKENTKEQLIIDKEIENECNFGISVSTCNNANTLAISSNGCGVSIYQDSTKIQYIYNTDSKDIVSFSEDCNYLILSNPNINKGEGKAKSYLLDQTNNLYKPDKLFGFSHKKEHNFGYSTNLYSKEKK